jgi:hypothetical protein
MSRNLAAGRGRLTEVERQAVDEIAREGTPEAQDHAFHEQLRILREKRKQERERGRDR